MIGGSAAADRRTTWGLMAAMADRNEEVCRQLWADLSPAERESTSRIACGSAGRCLKVLANRTGLTDQQILDYLCPPEAAPELRGGFRLAFQVISDGNSDPVGWLRRQDMDMDLLEWITGRLMNVAIACIRALFPTVPATGIAMSLRMHLITICADE